LSSPIFSSKLIDRIDQDGREIYFIDRNPEMFKYVLEYLRMQQLPPEIGTFQENSNLWRSLRNEAHFFALDGLTSRLNVTYSCSPDEDGGKGILHWLGTEKGNEKYTNPYRRGILDVTGWMDSFETLGQHDPSWGCSERKEFFVQHRPMSETVREYENDGQSSDMVYFPCLTGCNHSSLRLPVVLDLRKSIVSPTHYSLRHGGFKGMDGSWNFEASTDGTNWVLLHEGRKSDGHNLTYERKVQRHALGESGWFHEMQMGDQQMDPILCWPEVYCDYMERHYRHTWEINNNATTSQFFRYFRVIGADPVGTPGGDLHFIGLEIYGNVCEE